MEGGNHAAGAILLTNAVAEFLGDRGANGGSGLHDDVLAGGFGGVDLLDFAVLSQGAGWAHLDALAALEARNLREGTVANRGDDRVEATLFEAKDADALSVFAPFDAAAAEDALAGVADEAGSEFIEGGRGLRAEELLGAGADDLRDMEEFALPVFGAGLAIHGVVGEKEFDRSATGADGHRGGDFDLESLVGRAVGDGVDAGGEEPSAPSGRDFD